MSREWVPSAVYVHKKTTQNSIANKSKQDRKTKEFVNLFKLAHKSKQNSLAKWTEF